MEQILRISRTKFCFPSSKVAQHIEVAKNAVGIMRSQNFTLLSMRSLNQGLCISFQLKLHMWCHETGRTARVSGMQDVNMSPERVTRHFTLFVAVLSLFLSRFGAELDHS